jgi:plastocyanin
MKSKHLRVVSLILILLAFGSIVVAACTRPGTAASGSSTPVSSSGSPTAVANGSPTAAGSGSPTTPGNCATGTAHTLVSSFQESCVDVTKGGQLQIVPVVQSVHILDTGSWVNGSPVPMNEPGAPTINNVQVTSTTVSVGPFNMAGTFKIYCTIHQNMNLTVVVR